MALSITSQVTGLPIAVTPTELPEEEEPSAWAVPSPSQVAI